MGIVDIGTAIAVTWHNENKKRASKPEIDGLVEPECTISSELIGSWLFLIRIRENVPRTARTLGRLRGAKITYQQREKPIQVRRRVRRREGAAGGAVLGASAAGLGSRFRPFARQGWAGMPGRQVVLPSQIIKTVAQRSIPIQVLFSLKFVWQI
jgi:hypothetical protein